MDNIVKIIFEAIGLSIQLEYFFKCCPALRKG